MRLGASTANLYPALTEQSLSALLQMGFRVIEVFWNTREEASAAFSRKLRAQAEAMGGEIVAAHPYLSLAEPFCLFSRYERRFREGLEEYRRLFEGAAEMGARYLVLHGDRAESPALPWEEFAARYAALYDAGRACGVTLLQENVVHFRAQSPDAVRRMRALLGERAQFVLDLKQCRRAGVPAAQMLDAMGGALRHLHLSDGARERDCLLPGEGTEDFAALFRQLQAQGYAGDGVIELYRQNFEQECDLWRGQQTLSALLPAGEGRTV